MTRTRRFRGSSRSETNDIAIGSEFVRRTPVTPVFAIGRCTVSLGAAQRHGCDHPAGGSWRYDVPPCSSLLNFPVKARDLYPAGSTWPMGSANSASLHPPAGRRNPPRRRRAHTAVVHFLRHAGDRGDAGRQQRGGRATVPESRRYCCRPDPRLRQTSIEAATTGSRQWERVPRSNIAWEGAGVATATAGRVMA